MQSEPIIEASSEPIVSTRFYRWDGDPCRIHSHANGDLTADLYRGGKGHVPVGPVDILFGGSEISESMYQELVLEEIELNKRRENR